MRSKWSVSERFADALALDFEVLWHRFCTQVLPHVSFTEKDHRSFYLNTPIRCLEKTAWPFTCLLAVNSFLLEDLPEDLKGIKKNLSKHQ